MRVVVPAQLSLALALARALNRAVLRIHCHRIVHERLQVCDLSSCILQLRGQRLPAFPYTRPRDFTLIVRPRVVKVEL